MDTSRLRGGGGVGVDPDVLYVAVLKAYLS